MEPTEGYPVTIYDVDKQKAVLVFNSYRSCGKYITDKDTKGPYIGYIIRTKTKIKHTKNVFGKNLTARLATKPQQEMLDNNTFFKILDEDYRRDDVRMDNYFIKKINEEFYKGRNPKRLRTMYAGAENDENKLKLKCSHEVYDELMIKIKELFKQYE